MTVSTRDRGRMGRRDATAFTLIELMIVIGIIVILVALAVVVGTKVTEGGRKRSTANVVRVLDESRAAWERNADEPLPAILEVEMAIDRSQFFPLFDGRLAGAEPDDPAWPTMQYFTALVMQDPSVSAIFEQIDARLVTATTAPAPDFDGEVQGWELPAVQIKDAWDRPLRLVHPAFHGGHGDYWDSDARRLKTDRETLRHRVPNGRGSGYLEMEVRRSWRPFEASDSARRPSWVGDADEGMVVGGTPYFYSAGADGDPGTRKDNVYATKPRFPVETRNFD